MKEEVEYEIAATYIVSAHVFPIDDELFELVEDTLKLEKKTNLRELIDELISPYIAEIDGVDTKKMKEDAIADHKQSLSLRKIMKLKGFKEETLDEGCVWIKYETQNKQEALDLLEWLETYIDKRLLANVIDERFTVMEVGEGMNGWNEYTYENGEIKKQTHRFHE